MNLETLLTRLEPEYLLKQEDKEVCNILKLSVEKIFKNKEIVVSELDSAQYFIQNSLKYFEKRNPIFNYLIEVLDKEEDEELVDRLMHILVDTSRSAYINEYLVDVLKTDNLKLKLPIYYHNSIYPIRRIVQSKEFRESIVDFINSKEYPIEFERRKNFPGYHSELFAFPGQYENCFQIKDFDEELIEGISKSKMSKLVTQERLESIRLIKDENTQLRLLWLYYSQYLPTLYKTRFVKLVDKEFPHLKKLRKNNKYFFYC